MVDIYEPCRRVNGCGPPSYDPSKGYFTVCVWIKGELSVERYYGENLEHFDWCHRQNIALSRLDQWVVRLGCIGTVTYYWKPTFEPWIKLQFLDMESDLLEVVKQATLDGSVDIYVKHLEDETDMEFIELGHHLRYVRGGILHWNEFVESVMESTSRVVVGGRIPQHQWLFAITINVVNRHCRSRT